MSACSTHVVLTCASFTMLALSQNTYWIILIATAAIVLGIILLLALRPKNKPLHMSISPEYEEKIRKKQSFVGSYDHCQAASEYVSITVDAPLKSSFAGNPFENEEPKVDSNPFSTR